MNNIIIESVNGGWIVKELFPIHTTGETHVFTNIERLKEALPKLLKAESRELPEAPEIGTISAT